jgi:hypothetical protein
MMEEMYDWYMENLFGEHYKIAVRHAEKDGRDRKKRLAKQGPFRGNNSVPGMNPLERKMLQILAGEFTYNPDTSRSKWERIGSPMTASVVDWGIIINPYTPSRMKWKAISRQYDRYEEFSN